MTIDGARVAANENEGRATPRWHPLVLLVLAAIPFAVGADLGYQVAYRRGIGGLDAALAMFAGTLMIAGVVCVLVVIAIVAAVLPGGGGRQAAKASAAAAVLVVVGAGVGYALTPTLGLEQRYPVMREAQGSLAVTVTSGAAFVAPADTASTCVSGLDTLVMSRVRSLDLGGLSGKFVTRQLLGELTILGATSGAIHVWIGGPDFENQEPQPHWQGPLVSVSVDNPSRASGHATFDVGRVARIGDVGASSAWPSRLRGELTWSCGPWLPEGESGS